MPSQPEATQARPAPIASTRASDPLCSSREGRTNASALGEIGRHLRHAPQDLHAIVELQGAQQGSMLVDQARRRRGGGPHKARPGALEIGEGVEEHLDALARLMLRGRDDDGAVPAGRAMQRRRALLGARNSGSMEAGNDSAIDVGAEPRVNQVAHGLVVDEDTDRRRGRPAARSGR